MIEQLLDLLISAQLLGFGIWCVYYCINAGNEFVSRFDIVVTFITRIVGILFVTQMFIVFLKVFFSAAKYQQYTFADLPFGFQHDRGDAVAGQVQGRGQANRPSTDDHHRVMLHLGIHAGGVGRENLVIEIKRATRLGEGCVHRNASPVFMVMGVSRCASGDDFKRSALMRMSP